MQAIWHAFRRGSFAALVTQEMRKRALAETSLCIALLLGVNGPTLAMADLGATHSLDIPAQDLGNALQALGTMTSEQLLFSSDAVAGKRSTEVKGTYTTDTAISILLKGSGLKAERTSSGVLLIRQHKSQDEGSKAAKPTTVIAHSGMLRLALAGDQDSTGASTLSVDQPHSGGADSPATAADGTQDVSTIVISGSRAVRNGNEAPTPVTVLNSQELSASQSTLPVDSLAELPSLSNSTTRTSIGGSTAMGPGSFLNLRGLGATRTLVLLDGRRLAPSTNQGTVDVAMIPSLLLQRVDIVTGGASAAYGSDAVSGVVNFVLDNKLQGFKGELSGGETTRGDVPKYHAALAYGGSFADDRLHLLASIEYFQSDGLGGLNGSNGRSYLNGLGGLIPNPSVSATNPASPSNPRYLLANDVTYPYATFGGLIVGGPLDGIEFGPGGTPSTFQSGSLRSANAQVGGDGAYFSRYLNYLSPLNLYNGFGKLTFDVNSSTHAYVQLLYSKNDSSYVQDPPFQEQGTAYTIYAGNPFIPASVANLMQQAGVSSFKLGRVDTDWPFITAHNGYQTYDITTGVQGEIGSWNYDAYYEHGLNHFYLNMLNEPNVSRVYQAADAVADPVTGQAVCRTTLADPSNGCVPLNVFGPGAASAAALAYVQGTLMTEQSLVQNVASINVNGSPASTWAGPISLGFGAEYRNEEGTATVDPISASPIVTDDIRGIPASYMVAPPGGWQTNNPQPLHGSYHIREGYLEALLPLARKLPLIESFDINLAGRYTDYSTSGGVETWKAGLTYAPVSDVHLRATESRDIRAPNLQELFAGNAQSYVTIQDPQNNNAQVVNVVNQRRGNPDLTPEKANTFTGGVVYQPSWLRGFSGSVDYYDIKIKDEIAQLASQDEVDLCAQGNAALCSQIVRQNGQIVLISTPTLNLAQAHTEGVDIELDYRRPLSEIFSGLSGVVSARVLGTYLGSQSTSTPTAAGIATIESAGDIGDYAEPKWRWYGSAEYEGGRVAAALVGRFIGGGRYDNLFTASDLANNRVGSVFYLDLTLKYRMELGGSEEELFFTVNNILDRDPPVVPANNFNANQVPLTIYDIEGRAFMTGIRFKF